MESHSLYRVRAEYRILYHRVFGAMTLFNSFHLIVCHCTFVGNGNELAFYRILINHRRKKRGVITFKPLSVICVCSTLVPISFNISFWFRVRFQSVALQLHSMDGNSTGDHYIAKVL